MGKPNNLLIMTTILVISFILKNIVKTFNKKMRIIIGIIFSIMSLIKLKVLNESNDGFLAIGILLEVFISGIIGFTLLFSLL